MTIISAGNSNVSIELGNIIIIVAENVICSKVSVKIGHTLTHTVNGGYSFLSRSKNVTEITENTSSSWHLFTIFVTICRYGTNERLAVIFPPPYNTFLEEIENNYL